MGNMWRTMHCFIQYRATADRRHFGVFRRHSGRRSLNSLNLVFVFYSQAPIATLSDQLPAMINVKSCSNHEQAHYQISLHEAPVFATPKPNHIFVRQDKETIGKGQDRNQQQNTCTVVIEPSLDAR
jgi:hypothetical protein